MSRLDDLDWFFRSPRSAPNSGEGFSQLYLLRRDIDTCFGTDPNTGALLDLVDKATGGRITCTAIWPGTMAILAGMDLLGKFLAGTDRTRGPDKVGVGTRFTQFATRYLDLREPDADLIYQLRNSLLHSFGLYSEREGQDGTVTAIYNFMLTRGLSSLVERLNSDCYRVDVQCLRERFSKAVAKYQADLRDSSCVDYQNLNDNFNAMFTKHAKPMLVFKVPRA